jgi:hypothetical protein
MATLKLAPEAAKAYTKLDSAATAQLLDAVDHALDLLEADPGDKRCRTRAFGERLWGIPVRDRTEDWLIIWEHDLDDDDVVRVRYLGPDPFA